MRLLDEMGSLADGDLTVEATVTEDITGTIADSFNFAIEELRKLVATVNETALMVDTATKQTENTAAHLAKAADHQAKEINAATESIVSNGRVDRGSVSGNAERSSDVARHSVEVAHKGGEAVRRTIDGMNAIRETIQETSKRIKRLGESSQEIGNIVELINDIAEQTNILALNASIQASMAGEAGRGFRGGCRRGPATRGTIYQCNETDRSAGAHDSGRYQRSRDLDGTQYHRRSWRCIAGRECGCGTR